MNRAIAEKKATTEANAAASAVKKAVKAAVSSGNLDVTGFNDYLDMDVSMNDLFSGWIEHGLIMTSGAWYNKFGDYSKYEAKKDVVEFLESLHKNERDFLVDSFSDALAENVHNSAYEMTLEILEDEYGIDD